MRTGILPARRETGIWVIPGQEKAHAFSIRSRCRITGFPKYRWDYGEDAIPDVKKYRTICVRNCPDKLVESMEAFPEERKPKPRDLVLVDFQTLSCTPFRSIMRDTLSGIIMWKLSRRKMGWK